MALDIQHSCEIENLVDEVVEISNKDYESVELAFFKAGIYPESSKKLYTFFIS